MFVNMKWFPIILSAIIVALFIFVIKAKLFDIYMAWYFFITTIVYIVGIIILFVLKKLEMDKVDEMNNVKKSFDYCWRIANNKIKNMPGSMGLLWEQGFSKSSHLKEYTNPFNRKPSLYRSFEALLLPTRKNCVIIVDVDKEDIAMFDSNPSAELVENHFKDFDPFNAKNLYSQESNMYRRYGDKYRRRNKGISINIGDDDRTTSMGGGFSRPDDFVDDATDF